jgi:hypothetical protein
MRSAFLLVALLAVGACARPQVLEFDGKTVRLLMEQFSKDLSQELGQSRTDKRRLLTWAPGQVRQLRSRALPVGQRLLEFV